MRKLKILSTAAVVSFLVARAVAAVNLPPSPLSFTAAAGANSTFNITFSGIGTGFDISNSTYLGWALAVNPVIPDPNAAQSGFLVSTVDGILSPPFDVLPWGPINYLLNNKTGSPQDVQLAIIGLVNGIAPDTNLYPNAAQMFAEAQTLGANFVPEPSDTIALLLEWAGSSENVTIIELPPSSVEGADRFTAGGFIVRNGAKSNFGIRGGMHNGRLWGGITYLDQAAGVKVTGRACTSYMVVDTNCRRAVYDVSINGVAGTATVVVCDNGEPGRTDSVQITLSTGYSNGGVLGGGNKGGGNVQLHKPKPVSGKRSALGR